MSIDMKLITQARAQTLTNMIALLNEEPRTERLFISIIQELNGMALFDAPAGTVKEGELTLNISMAACPSFTLTEDGMAIAEMRFQGKQQTVVFPATLIRTVTSIDSAGAPFFQEAFVPFCANPEAAQHEEDVPVAEAEPAQKRGHLRLVH